MQKGNFWSKTLALTLAALGALTWCSTTVMAKTIIDNNSSKNISNRPTHAHKLDLARNNANLPERQAPLIRPSSQTTVTQQQVSQPASTVKKTVKVKKDNLKKNTKKTAGSTKSTVSGNSSNYQTLQQGDSGWRVKISQQKLEELGYSEERPSGKYTAATTAAVKNFQKQQKLSVTGKIDGPTYNKLNWLAFVKDGIHDVKGNEVVQQASRYSGVKYVFGGTTPSGFDCSGYVQYIFKKFNAGLPRLADEQALEGIFVTQKQLKPGDLVFFTTYEPGASHVGIYAGNNRFWHTSSSRGVMLSSLQDEYWRPRYYGARRVLISNGEQ